jgi:2,3-bisphosphoglycerate-dependent phosphoglycerate mutase
MTHFYLIRHAHAHWMPDEGRPLSAKGQENALRVAELLGKSPITSIYSSPFQRARQTVSPLADRLGLPIHIEPGLRERELGDAPGYTDFHAAVERVWQDPSYAHPGGESNAVAQRRGVTVVERLRAQYPGGHVVLSTHGNLMALVLQHYDAQIDYNFWKALTEPDVYALQLEGDEVSINWLWPGAG